MTRSVRMAFLAALALGTAALAGAAEGLPPLLDRELFFGNPEIAGAQLSPDGQYVAFLKPWKDTRNIYVKKTSEPFDKARLRHDRDEAADPGLLLQPRQQADPVREGQGRRRELQRLGGRSRRRRTPRAARRPPRATSRTPRARARSSTRSRRSRPTRSTSASTTATPPGTTSTRSRSRPAQRELVRKNTERIAGWDFDLDGQLRLADARRRQRRHRDPAGRARGLQEGLLVHASSRPAAPSRFHKDGRRVYMQTNKGDVDLTRLVLFDPETGKEELVESDPMNRVDFGSADLRRGHGRAGRDLLRGRAGAPLLPGQGLGGRLQAAPGASSRARTSRSARARPTTGCMLITANERHRPGRALHLRPQHQEADAPVQGARADPARAHGAA